MFQQPAYLRLYQSGELEKRVEEGYRILKHCSLCPRRCGVDRLAGERGFCQVGLRPVIYKYKVHRGEEPPISGSRGSGIIFLSGCTLRCVYCQNYPMSHLRRGREISVGQMAKIMMALQKADCHNLNVVTPTHFVPQILDALLEAVDAGFSLPLVYNTSGYESAETLRLLDGVVDIYLPDLKYSREEMALRYSSAPNYPAISRAALREMHRQVGDLELDEEGLARRGILIRHLILPNGISGTESAMRFISELSQGVFISLMSQYLPIWRAREHPLLSRQISQKEYEKALRIVERYGLDNGWLQQMDCGETATSQGGRRHP